MNTVEKTPIEKLVLPLQSFIKQEKSGGIVLGISVIIALILANSPVSEAYHHFLNHKLGFRWDSSKIFFEFSLHHWINDGLMAVFFFVVGLELKREIFGGELSSLDKAILPFAAALGGMLVPAAIYLLFNYGKPTQKGWAIPMATDIAFALGVLYLLGNRISLTLKVFLMALAIVDDLGAVLVIAFFYTSDISFLYLGIGIAFLMVMLIGNKLGVRNVIFYAILGIGGVWTAFLLSGVHATIAAVLAAFVIPGNAKINEKIFGERISKHIQQFSNADKDEAVPSLTHEQFHYMEKIKQDTNDVLPPMQKLEHALHPFVTFVVIPVFALANAGVSFLDIDAKQLFNTNVISGVALGLFLGKVLGVVGFSWICIKLKIATFPDGINLINVLGLALLSAIGFTMSLFITQLAFTTEEYIVQAKIGIFSASILGGVLGYWILRINNKTV